MDRCHDQYYDRKGVGSRGLRRRWCSTPRVRRSGRGEGSVDGKREMTKNTIPASPPARSVSLPSRPRPKRPDHSALWNHGIASMAIRGKPSISGKRGYTGVSAKAGDRDAALACTPLRPNFYVVEGIQV